MQRTQFDTPIIDAGESCDLIVTLTDMASTPAAIDPGAVATFTLTLYDELTLKVINSRNDQDIQGANGTTIAANVATVRLQPADNVLVGTSESEWHIARIDFTWPDGTQTRTGMGEARFSVQQAVTPVVFTS
jgi:hypothetical protein